MQNLMQRPAQPRRGDKSGFWFALAAALALHAIILLLPMSGQTPEKNRSQTPIELQLTTFLTDVPVPLVPEEIPEEIPEDILEKPIAESAPLPEPESAEPELPILTPAPIRELVQDLEKMTPDQKTRLTNAVLMRQFISEESAVDRIFGKPLEPQATEPQKEFHYPARQNMITMLEKPMQDLPFAYTPDLIYFAYDPGVRGDLQRFWDVITPEFGWRTDNGTEFRCKWILVIAACGWK